MKPFNLNFPFEAKLQKKSGTLRVREVPLSGEAVSKVTV